MLRTPTLLAAASLALTLPNATSAQLVTGPTLVSSTYLGGSGGEFWADSNIAGIAVAADGTIVVAGDTATADLAPSPVDLRSSPGARDVFVARLSADGSAILSVTYLGGNGRDDRARLALAPDGSIVVCARTLSTNLPVTAGALQTTARGGADGFVARLDATASAITWMTYLGGDADESPLDLVVTTDAVVVVGQTFSSNFPTAGSGAQGGPGGGGDGFVARLNLSTGALTMATYLGGSSADQATGAAVTALGTIVVVGGTQSADLPVQPTGNSSLRGGSDAFLVLLDPTTAARSYASYWGGSASSTNEIARDVAVAGNGDLVVAGATDSADFPVQSAVKDTNGGGLDGFVTRFRMTSSGPVVGYSTYLGGSGGEAGMAVAVDALGNRLPHRADTVAKLPGGYRRVRQDARRSAGRLRGGALSGR